MPVVFSDAVWGVPPGTTIVHCRTIGWIVVTLQYAPGGWAPRNVDVALDLPVLSRTTTPQGLVFYFEIEEEDAYDVVLTLNDGWQTLPAHEYQGYGKPGCHTSIVIPLRPRWLAIETGAGDGAYSGHLKASLAQLIPQELNAHQAQATDIVYFATDIAEPGSTLFGGDGGFLDRVASDERTKKLGGVDANQLQAHAAFTQGNVLLVVGVNPYGVDPGRLADVEVDGAMGLSYGLGCFRSPALFRQKRWGAIEPDDRFLRSAMGVLVADGVILLLVKCNLIAEAAHMLLDGQSGKRPDGKLLAKTVQPLILAHNEALGYYAGRKSKPLKVADNPFGKTTHAALLNFAATLGLDILVEQATAPAEVSGKAADTLVNPGKQEADQRDTKLNRYNTAIRFKKGGPPRVRYCIPGYNGGQPTAIPD